MKRNVSPKASFETNENRLWFVAKSPIHPEVVPESEQLGDQVRAAGHHSLCHPRTLPEMTKYEKRPPQ
jgi:hypothetical protein